MASALECSEKMKEFYVFGMRAADSSSGVFARTRGGIPMRMLVTDELWQRVQPLLPPPPRRRFRFPGRKPLDYRRILTGILFVLKTGIAWDDLPAELGCGCGKTCRHYLQLWHEAGVWRQLHALLLAELNGADQIDWERALIDASFAKAPEGGQDTGPNPTDRSKSGSKHHVLTDAQGIPLSATVTAANVPEVTQVMDVLESMPPVGGKPGRARKNPERLQGDTGYDSEPMRTMLRWLGITPVLGKRRREHGSGLGKLRWYVERTISWLHALGRLRRRLDRLTEIQEAFLRLGCSMICLRFIT
jgi:transposase